MRAAPACLLHVRKLAARALSACAHRKRRPHLTGADVYGKQWPFEVTPGHSGRVERRAAGPTGQESFVPIRTRPTVARDPPPEVYGGARDARKTDFTLEVKSVTEPDLHCHPAAEAAFG